MPIYLFHLGREPQLSTAEIEAVFSAGGILYTVKEQGTKNREQHVDRLIIETTKPIDPSALMHRLGGTVKITEELTSPIISHLAAAQPTGKIDFAVNDRALALKIKKELKTLGRGARFVAIKNTATILFNHLVKKQSDLTVIGNQIFVTRAIQPIAELSERDYGRPGSDAKSGMLPPKLAKIMINLAQVPPEATILDPFCGSGTILTEAAAMGYKNIIGSDISDKAIENTKKNLEWLRPHFPFPISHFPLLNCDARSLSKKIKPHSIDAIVTEPYLGRPLTGRETRAFLERQAQELAALYTAAFASFQKILKPGGVIVFITPAFRGENEWITVPCFEVIKKLGYRPTSFLNGQKFLRYHRPTQHLARDVWRWVKK